MELIIYVFKQEINMRKRGRNSKINDPLNSFSRSSSGFSLYTHCKVLK
jgi:hypothetical protein